MTKIQIDKQVSIKVESDRLLTRIVIKGEGRDGKACLADKDHDQKTLLENLSSLSLEHVVLETDRLSDAYEIVDGKRERKGLCYTLGYRVLADIGQEKDIENALLNLRGKVSFTHSYALKDPEEGKKIALDMAIQKSREMADTIAQSLGMHIVGVEEVSTEDYQQGPVVLRSAMKAEIATPEHESAVSSHVHAVFLAE